MSENKLAMGIDNLPMIEAAFESIEGMEKFCEKILQSRLAPDHFYPKKEGSNHERDYSKGNTAAVMMVLIQGKQLGLPVMTSLQHVIPVNGLMSIKGDAAKAMVFSSGKLKKDSWKETTEGSIESGDMKVTITATRADTNETLSRSFSVEMAKRAGLWVTEEMTRKQDGYKKLASAWWKYPQRMITYRALGFLARDLFPDVLHGVYTTEEAVDIPQDETIVIESTTGVQAQIPGGGSFQEQRSKQLTGKAALQIDKRAGDMEPPPSDPVEDRDPEAPPERASKATMLNGTPGFIPVYTEDEMKEMDTSELLTLIEHDGLMSKAMEVDPGKNTNKKLRNIILAHYAGEVVVLIAKFDKEFQDPLGQKKDSLPEGPPPETEPEDPDEIPMEAVQEPEDPEVHHADADPIADQRTDAADVEANTTFDVSAQDEAHVKMSQDDPEQVNKFGIVVPELVDGKRSFEQVKNLFEEMANVAGVDNKVFDSLVQTKFPQFQHYRVKEDFCYKAEAAEVNTLLNSI